MYKKPVILETEDLTEGIYAASGSTETGNVTFSKGSSNMWSADDGQIQFRLRIPDGFHEGQSRLTVTFDKNIAGIWGAGGSWSLRGKEAVGTFWGLSSGNADITVQVNHGAVNMLSAKIEKA